MKLPLLILFLFLMQSPISAQIINGDFSDRENGTFYEKPTGWNDNQNEFGNNIVRKEILDETWIEFISNYQLNANCEGVIWQTS